MQRLASWIFESNVFWESKKRVKFGTAIHNTKGILDYIHTDVWGPTKKASLGVNIILLHLLMTFPEEFRCI